MTFEERKRLVHVSYDAWSRGDFDVLFSIYHPECEWDNRRFPLPDISPVSRGHDGMAEFHRTAVAPFLPHVVVRPADIVDLGEDRVFVEGRWEAATREARSDAVGAVPPFGQIVEFREGLVLRVEYFPTPAEGRRAAGLP